MHPLELSLKILTYCANKNKSTSLAIGYRQIIFKILKLANTEWVF